MDKKGDLSINTIVVAALALIVLIILIFVFRNQITNISGGFINIGNDAKEGAQGTKCQTFFGDRVCGKDTNTYQEGKYTLDPLPKPCVYVKKNGNTVQECGWSDCEKLSIPDRNCYEIHKI